MSDNDNNKYNFNDEENGSSIALGLVFGSAFGIILGMIFDKLLLGIAFGPSLGLLLGVIVDSNKN